VGVVDRINGRLAKSQSRDLSLSIDAYAQFFQFGGITYPLLQTTMGSVDRERIVGSAVGAHQGNTATWSLTAARIQAFSQIRFQWTRFIGAQPGPLWGTEALQLLEHPWPGGHTAHLLARMELDNSLSGNAYMVNARPGRLARLRPDLVTICLGSRLDAPTPADAPDVEVAGYAYFPRSGKPSFFLPDEVAHYAPFPDPNFQFLGMSWITPCIREIQADSLAVEHKARFFENAATPNLAIKFDPSLDIDAVRGFKDLMENEHQGAFNAYKTLYLGGGADPVTVGKDFQQLDFAVTQGHGESRLAAAAGVPSSWVGFSEGLQGSALNAGNFQSARRRFSDGTMQHLWMNAATALETVCQPPDRHASLWFDTRVPFMRDDATDIASIQQTQAAAISSLIMQGFDPKSVINAISQNDMSLLKHTGLASVQLQPIGSPKALPPSGNGNGNGQSPSQPATVGSSSNGSASGTDRKSVV
jgi:hypothetical protein